MITEEQLSRTAEIERAALGSAILGDCPDIFTIAKPEFFSTWQHREIASAIAEHAGEPINPLILSGWLNERKTFEKAGGMQYLGKLGLVGRSDPIIADEYARLVRESYKHRQLTEMHQKASKRLINGDKYETVESDFTIDRNALESSDFAASRSTVEFIEELAEAMVGGIDKPDWRLESLPALNQMLRGIYRNRYYIIGGESKSGKTALAVNNMITDLASQGAKILFNSTEMSEKQILARQAAALSLVPINVINSGKFDSGSGQQNRYATALKKMQRSPYKITNIPDIDQFVAEAKREHRRNGLDVIVVDYIQNMRADVKRTDGMVQMYQKISYELNALKHLGICVVALSQLNKEGTYKGTGEIVHNADHGIKILVEKDELGQPRSRRIFMNINRHGDTGVCPDSIQYRGDITKFIEQNIEDLNDNQWARA